MGINVSGSTVVLNIPKFLFQEEKCYLGKRVRIEPQFAGDEKCQRQDVSRSRPRSRPRVQRSRSIRSPPRRAGSWGCAGDDGALKKKRL